MPQIDKLLQNQNLRTTAIGLGIAVAVPVAVAFLAPYLRPVLRSAVKGGVVAFEKGKEAVAQVGESMDDLVAEIRDELREEREAAIAAMHEAAERATKGDSDNS
jgi:hypothetical protein